LRAIDWGPARPMRWKDDAYYEELRIGAAISS
jgi:hypothetical protein